MGKDAGEKSPQSYLYGTSRTFCSEDAARGLCSRPQQDTPFEIVTKQEEKQGSGGMAVPIR